MNTKHDRNEVVIEKAGDFRLVVFKKYGQEIGEISIEATSPGRVSFWANKNGISYLSAAELETIAAELRRH